MDFRIAITDEEPRTKPKVLNQSKRRTFLERYQPLLDTISGLTSGSVIAECDTTEEAENLRMTLLRADFRDRKRGAHPDWTLGTHRDGAKVYFFKKFGQ